MKQEKIYLKDYQPPHYAVDKVALDFILNEDFCRVTAKSQMRQLRNADLELNGEKLNLITVKVNDQVLSPHEYQRTDELLILKNLPAEFTLEIETRLEPQNNTALEGLYKSNGIFCTQCEAQSFRMITYFLDRPDVMTTYSVRIEADKAKYPVLLSNGDRIEVKDLGNGRHQALWRDPHKKPCYLFALVAGDLGVIRDQFVTRSGRRVNLEVYAAHGKQDRCAHAMASLKKSMKWDEDTFGLEYDLNDYMIVAIDDFNAGAMENKGLNIFNSRLVLADKNSATDSDFQAIEAVVAHEYFHNWTGNRVTLRDWFQLSLKEGLTVFRDQEFSADMLDRGVQRIEDVDNLRGGQFAEDAGPNAHPVRPESCLSVDNFFTMTIYEKGAELIRMMQTIVGRKGFRKGMDEYFKRHDGQAVTTEDFAAAIAEPNHKDFTQLKLWYSQAGTPQVSVTERYEAAAQEYHLHIEQTCAPTPQQAVKKPFYIPLMLGLLDSQGREMPLNCDKVVQNSDGKFLLELKENAEDFVFQKVAERPVLSILREFSAPVNLKFATPDENYYFLMEKDTDSFNRRESAQKMSLQVLGQLIRQVREVQDLKVDAAYAKAVRTVIEDRHLDAAFKANMLQLPSDAILAQEETVLDAPAFLKARQTLKRFIAKENRSALLEIYQQAHAQDDAKQRQLKNTVLSYLSELNEDSIWEIIASQYDRADNMTDRLVAMALLANGDHTARPRVLSDFYENWKEDSVVINKWFSAQAWSSRENTLAEVQALCRHPVFNINNPNNVYSLLRTFSGNLSRFFEPSGAAFEFYADKILEIDLKNPQVAARLCAAFNFVDKLNPATKAKAQTQIKRILAEEKLSKNSRELLQSSLAKESV